MIDTQLRTVTDADTEILLAIYISTRREEVAQTGWPESRQQAFLAMQARAQHEHYARHYPEAERSLILAKGEVAGRLYVGHWQREIRIVDIALLPPFRGAGIGSRLLQALQERARTDGKPLSIHVEKTNPALRLYQRLGFKQREDKGVYLLMDWRPGD